MKHKRKIMVLCSAMLLMPAAGIWWWLHRNPYTVSRAYIEETNKETARMRQEAANPSSERLAALAVQAEKMQQGSDAMVMAVQFYGKVIDQYGNPVPDMKVSYDAGNAPFTRGSGPGFVMTESDGSFVIANVKANILDIRALEKENYEVRAWVTFRGYNQGGGDGVGSWADYRKEKPYVFKAWKAEKYAKVTVGEEGVWRFERNQTYTLDLHGEKGNRKFQGLQPGDLRVLFSADDEGWKVKIAAVDGGLQETGDEYMNLAPELGYLPELEYSGKKTNYDSLRKQYYLQSRNGQSYGALKVEILPYYSSSVKDSAIVMSYVINLEGGRELAVRPNE